MTVLPSRGSQWQIYLPIDSLYLVYLLNSSNWIAMPPKAVIWPLFRWGLLHPLPIQLCHSDASETDGPGTSRECDSHPWVLECVVIMWINCGSFVVITSGHQVKLPHRGSNDQQIPALSLCFRQWGGTSSQAFLSNGGCGVGGGFHKILSLNWQWQYMTKQGGLGHWLVDPRWIAPKPWTTPQWSKLIYSYTISIISTTPPAKGWRSRLLGRLSFSTPILQASWVGNH